MSGFMGISARRIDVARLREPYFGTIRAFWRGS